MLTEQELEDLRKEEAKKEWDHHSSYQWTYFPEEAKQLIQFFLSDRIHGKNLDIGSGWYTYHPRSTVVDFSQRGLDYNCAPNKVLFDLEEIAKGKKLPIPDHSHHSATLVSVWQYIKNRRAVLGELERVLVPGSEVFIINQSGSGLTSHFQGPTDPRQIEKDILREGYDCIREKIPFGESPFQSVTVAMPGVNLFGRDPFVRDRSDKLRLSVERMEDPSSFKEDFCLWETHRAVRAFQQLASYPITSFSVEYTQRLQKLADDIQGETGHLPIIMMGSHPAYLHLATPDKIPHIMLSTLQGRGSAQNEKIQEMIRDSGLRIYRCVNYMGVLKIDELNDKLRNIREEHKHDMVNFLGSLSLSNQTRDLQSKVYGALKPTCRDLDERIERAKKSQLYVIGREHKQRREVDELARAKARILDAKTPCVGEARLDYFSGIDYYANQVRKNLEVASRSWDSPCYDD